MGDFAFPGFKKVVWVPDPVGLGGERKKEVVDGGLTKREYFAGLAMQGILAKHGYGDLNPHVVSSAAIHQADSLLEFIDKSIPGTAAYEREQSTAELKKFVEVMGAKAKSKKKHPMDDSDKQDELPL